jgi:hypothetical protein
LIQEYNLVAGYVIVARMLRESNAIEKVMQSRK